MVVTFRVYLDGDWRRTAPPSGPGWLATALGFWSGRALATGMAARRGRVYV